MSKTDKKVDTGVKGESFATGYFRVLRPAYIGAKLRQAGDIVEITESDKLTKISDKTLEELKETPPTAEEVKAAKDKADLAAAQADKEKGTK